MFFIKIDVNGMKYDIDDTIYWGSPSWRPSRPIGPSFIRPNGFVQFSSSSGVQFSRKQGPAVIYPDGGIFYYNQLGHRHREDGPAIIYPHGDKAYFINGIQMDLLEYFSVYGAY